MRGRRYQQAATVVVIQQQQQQQQQPCNRRGPEYFNNGIQLGGVALSFPVVWCMGIFGGMLFFGGILYIYVSNRSDNRSLSIFPGLFMLGIGGGLIVACICIARYAKKKYSQSNTRSDNSGWVINPAPSPRRQPNNAQPDLAHRAPQACNQMTQYSPCHANKAASGAHPSQAGYSPEGGYAPQQTQGGYAQQPPSGYIPPVRDQPSENPPPYSAPVGPVPGFPSAAGNETKYPLPSSSSSAPPSDVPGVTQNTNE